MWAAEGRNVIQMDYYVLRGVTHNMVCKPLDSVIGADFVP